MKVNALRRIVDGYARAAGTTPRRAQRWVSFMLVAAAIERVVEPGEPPVLVTGGVAMELRLGLRARATGDLDAVWGVEGSAVDALGLLGDRLVRLEGEFGFRMGSIEAIGPTRAARAMVQVVLNGRPWNSVRLELSTAEADLGASFDSVVIDPALSTFKLDGPETIACMPLPLQIAQKLHALTDLDAPEDPARCRHVLDVVLLLPMVTDRGELARVVHAVFERRGMHELPAMVDPRADWPAAYEAFAAEAPDAPPTVEQALMPIDALLAELTRP